MPIKITYKKGTNDKFIKNFVLFTKEGFKIHALDKTSLSNKAITPGLPDLPLFL